MPDSMCHMSAPEKTALRLDCVRLAHELALPGDLLKNAASLFGFACADDNEFAWDRQGSFRESLASIFKDETDRLESERLAQVPERLEKAPPAKDAANGGELP